MNCNGQLTQEKYNRALAKILVDSAAPQCILAAAKFFTTKTIEDQIDRSPVFTDF